MKNNNIQELTNLLELMEEAAQCGFDVPSDWILKLKIEKGFFNTLKSDLDLSKIALQKVVSSLEYFRQTVVGRKYSLFEGPLICRVKTHHSIFKKMWRKRNPQSDEPCHYREFPDLCGVRVTVNYLDDIYEVMDYISSHSKSYQLQERDDKLSVPNEDGYRGYHAVVKVPLEQEEFTPMVEIQVRTGYQNSWSIKTHQLTYKNEELINKFQKGLKEYSDILFQADQKCLELRKEIADYLKSKEK